MGDLEVVVLDVHVLLLVLEGALLNLSILALFNLQNLGLPLLLHGRAEVAHLGLVFELDLVANALMIVPNACHFSIVGFVKGVFVFFLSLLLLFLSHLEGPQVLF